MANAFANWFNGQAGCIVIGEIGVNHNGSLDLAKKMIDVAVESGADAVKFQTFSAEQLATRTAEKAAYQNCPKLTCRPVKNIAKKWAWSFSLRLLMKRPQIYSKK